MSYHFIHTPLPSSSSSSSSLIQSPPPPPPPPPLNTTQHNTDSSRLMDVHDCTRHQHTPLSPRLSRALVVSPVTHRLPPPLQPKVHQFLIRLPEVVVSDFVRVDLLPSAIFPRHRREVAQQTRASSSSPCTTTTTAGRDDHQHLPPGHLREHELTRGFHRTHPGRRRSLYLPVIRRLLRNLPDPIRIDIVLAGFTRQRVDGRIMMQGTRKRRATVLRLR